MVYYHHTDHLGSIEVVTDESGTVVWEVGYEAFGSVLSERGDSSFTPNYTGKFFDKASGLYYFNARWYDSELGRFTTSDPIRDGVNWWNYCNGNPITRIDLNGKYDFDIENGIIYCDLNNSEDVALSSTQFVMYEHRGFPTCIAKDDSSGVYLQFNDSETMVNFVTENCYDKDYGAKIENFIDTFGSIASMADVAKISNMSAVSNILGSLSLGIDLMK